jgi:hypothetical protein
VSFTDAFAPRSPLPGGEGQGEGFKRKSFSPAPYPLTRKINGLALQAKPLIFRPLPMGEEAPSAFSHGRRP